MSVKIDGVIKDWGDRIIRRRLVRGGGVKNVKSQIAPKPTSSVFSPATRENLRRVVNKTPEVMVKISGGGKNMGQIKAHMDYISRNGLVELEDETGMIHSGKEQVREVRDAWSMGRVRIPETGEGRREAFNIVLSMPPGTDRESVKNAAREFAAQQFSNHQYVFAAHDDEKHPHVHLAVKAMDKRGRRLNPRKADLQSWRELFAEKLREQGIEANATPRRARGVVKKAEKQAERQMVKRGAKSKARQARINEAMQEAAGQTKIANPASQQIVANRQEVLSAYGDVARTLVRGDSQDKELAVQVVNFVKQMPKLQTRHQELVEAIRTGAERGQERPQGVSKGSGKGRAQEDEKSR